DIPVAFVGGYLLFSLVNGTLGAMPFDPDRTHAIDATVLPVIDTPLVRVNGVAADLSASGDLVYVKATDRSRIVLLDKQGRVIGSTSDEANFSAPRYSPDGRRFVVERRGDNPSESDLWMYDVGSATLQRLTADGVSFSPSGWSPDGQRVLFNRS